MQRSATVRRQKPWKETEGGEVRNVTEHKGKGLSIKIIPFVFSTVKLSGMSLQTILTGSLREGLGKETFALAWPPRAAPGGKEIWFCFLPFFFFLTQGDPSPDPKQNEAGSMISRTGRTARKRQERRLSTLLPEESPFKATVL